MEFPHSKHRYGGKPSLHTHAATIRQELNDLFAVRFPMPPDKVTPTSSKNMLVVVPSPLGPPQTTSHNWNNHVTNAPPTIPPKPPPRLLQRYNLSTTQLNETNRQLLKEMIEKNRTRRRLSNPLTKENRSSGSSYIINNPYVRSQSMLAEPTSTMGQNLTVVNTNTNINIKPSTPMPRPLPLDNLPRLQSRTDGQEPGSQVSQEENETLEPAQIIPTENLIDLTTENASEVDSNTDAMPISQDLEVIEAGPSDQSGSDRNSGRATWPPVDILRNSDVAASSQSLDSFLHPTTTTVVPEPQQDQDHDMNATQSTTSLNSSIGSYDDSPGELRVSNKVVWFTPHGVPETGTVKWIGKLKDRYHAGVEFERPVGNSSGLYGGRKLFNCSLTHGRFVPVSELILHIDFYAGSCSNEPSPYSCGIPKKESHNNNHSESKAYSEPPIVCVICQDSLIISTSVDDDEEDSLIADYKRANKSCRKNLSKSMDELSFRDRPDRQQGLQGVNDGRGGGSGSGSTNHNNKEMVATKCGHLFHSGCLSQWFSLKKRLHQPCPYCQHLMHIEDTIRIYPVQGSL